MSSEAMVVRSGDDAALAAVSREAGVMALAYMGDADFEARLEAMKRGQERVRRIQRELMVGPSDENPAGEDYGVIPGTKKPTLLKPGAEKLCNVYGLVPTYEETWIEGDGVTIPHLRVRMRCFLRRGSENGPLVAVGVGAANSWERKHRYRGGQRSCPGCGCEGTIRRSKFEDRETGDKGWYCHERAGGCGAQFKSTDPAIVDQQAGQVENPDPYDVENTLYKMAKKRSYIDATLNATATSGMFAQDVEDLPGTDGGATDSPRPEAARETSSRREPERAERPAQERPPAREREQQQAGGGKSGTLPRWTGPCPKCKATGPVMVSKKDAGKYYCFPGSSRGKGCGYTFGPKDAEMHASAAETRGGEDLSDFGVER